MEKATGVNGNTQDGKKIFAERKKTGVDVLVTFYNQEKYVDQALESVMIQKTDFPFRVLVGDDGSSDHTRDKVEAWQRRFPGQIMLYVMERIPSKECGGFRFSRNRWNLMKHVEAKYFTFLDGDDFYDDPAKLQKQFDILENPENADCIMCAHDLTKLYPDGKRVRINGKRLKEGKLTKERYWKKWYCSPETEMIRSCFIEKIPEKLLKNTFDDNIITFTALQHGKMYYLPESMAVYVQTGEGLYTGGELIFNYLRNMMALDLALKIDPNMRQVTYCRFAGTWRVLLRVREEINPEKYQDLSEESHTHELKNAWCWIHYKELPVQEKRVLTREARIRSIRPAMEDMLFRVYGRLKQILRN